MGATIAVLSQKGGTGKTTTVRTLTDVFRASSSTVLAVDLDPQGNLSDYFDVDPEALADHRRRADRPRDGRRGDPRRDPPANLSLAEAELTLGGKMGRELTLSARCAVKDDYDLILLDCPPSLGLLTVNALVAADHALLTTEAQYFAMQGVEQALEVIELARDGLNPDLGWLGVVLNIADMRTRHTREAFYTLREHFGDKLFARPSRQSIAYAESAERARLDPRPPPRPRRRLPRVADELLARLKLPELRLRAEADRADARERGARHRHRASPLRGRRCRRRRAGSRAGGDVAAARAPAAGAAGARSRRHAAPKRAAAARRARCCAAPAARGPGGRVVRSSPRAPSTAPPGAAVVARRWRLARRAVATRCPTARGLDPGASAELLHEPYRARRRPLGAAARGAPQGRAVRRIGVGVGRPGTPTPTGRFAVTDTLRMRRAAAPTAAARSR